MRFLRCPACSGVNSQHFANMMAGYLFWTRSESSLSNGLILSGQVLANQRRRNREPVEIVEELIHFFPHRRFVPVISASIAVPIRTVAAYLCFVAVIVRLPVSRISQHRFLKCVAHLRAPMPRLPLEQLTLDSAQRKNCFSVGESQPWSDF